MRRARVLLAVTFATAIAFAAPIHAQSDPPPPPLDAGFHHLYELNFREARAQFTSYQKDHPDDPMGKAAEAASYLFEEFHQKGVFTSAFFLDDKKLLGGVEGPAVQNRNPAFLRANQQARQMARRNLGSNPKDATSLLVLSMVDGMESDYQALIEKRQLASLSLMRKAQSEAATALSVNPQAQDAYVAIGAGNYIIGCLPSYKRAFLWFGGVHGDRRRGMEQLESAAANGHYLQPFAKVLLALASVREHQPERARALLADLTREFPANPVFAHELALLNDHASRKH